MSQLETISHQEFAQKLKKANTLNEVIEAVYQLRGSIHSQVLRAYYPPEILRKIEQARHGHLDIQGHFDPEPLPAAFGLLDAVRRLLPNDPEYQKFLKRQAGKNKRRNRR